MSTTPRTNAKEHELHETWSGASMRKCVDGGWVESDFARDLERENAKLLAANAELITVGAELSAVADELRKDKARLDWLTGEVERALVLMTSRSLRVRQIWTREPGANWRAAIDAAMEAGK